MPTGASPVEGQGTRDKGKGTGVGGWGFGLGVRGWGSGVGEDQRGNEALRGDRSSASACSR
ncbi:MAG: hypothetical protein DWQ36_25205 [Acidobacteria bacterium]|nr:MAG: hypothetical protein DWQ30_02185 [Acidobacteriota bacterium]REJ99534.1 MAG: hypothetical protein DWQ36_25205 [Acidobacteriota bacterium]